MPNNNNLLMGQLIGVLCEYSDINNPNLNNITAPAKYKFDENGNAINNLYTVDEIKAITRIVACILVAKNKTLDTYEQYIVNHVLKPIEYPVDYKYLTKLANQ